MTQGPLAGVPADQQAKALGMAQRMQTGPKSHEDGVTLDLIPRLDHTLVLRGCLDPSRNAKNGGDPRV
jgi:hypothetical protein